MEATKLYLQLLADGGTVVNTTGGYVNAYTGQKEGFNPPNDLSAEMKTYYDTEMLENARPNFVHSQFAKKQGLPKNRGQSVEWRKWNTLADAGKLEEGVIPAGQKMGATTLVQSITQHGTYVTVSDELELRAIDNVILGATEELGASAGSTGGGLKVSRLVILVRAAQVEVRRLVRPRTVKVMRIDGKAVGQDTVRAVSGYLILYVLICMVSVLLVSLDGFDGSTTITAVLATFNNIGPGLGLVCPAGNFAMFSPLSKVVLCLDMLFGRLEIYPMLVLLLPSTWSKKT